LRMALFGDCSSGAHNPACVHCRLPRQVTSRKKANQSRIVSGT
jgi:hypothetical protein